MQFGSHRPLYAQLLAFLFAAAAAPGALAELTDVSQAPLIVASPDTVKANLLFILDDSGSMDYDFMPDHINTALCRSTGATNLNSGNFSKTCCEGGNSSNACWSGAAPFTLRAHPPFLAAGFNGAAYDPTVVYAPPIKADNTYWASQTRAATTGWTSVKNDAYNVQNTGSINLTTQFPDMEWCTSSTYSDCLRNDNYVLPGSVGGKSYTTYRATTATGTGTVATGAPDAASTASRTFGPHYYNIVPAEYCNSVDLRDCRTTPGDGYVHPAPLRWCKSDAIARSSGPAVAACQSTRNGTYSHARFPTKFFSAGSAVVSEVRAKVTFTVSSNSSCAIQVTSLRAGSLELLNASTVSKSDRGDIGNAIRDRINAKTSTGYTAATTNSGRTVTITAPAGTATTATLAFTKTPSHCSFNLDNSNPSFSGYVAEQPAQPGSYGGRFERVDIVPSRTSYPKSATRTDCTSVAGSCTYDEEMTNFANWWTYYHSRMQSMKSSAALAFGSIGNNRRVGYMSINNATSKDYLNLDTFESTQKTNWFAKLVAAKPSGSTPLRTALSTAGRLFGGKLNGKSLNGSTVKDPVQYSCQRNFTILSTDGFWNEGTTPAKLDGTAIGNQDATLDRPMYDGTGTSNSLADVAAYYANTDLRTGTTGSSDCTSGSGTNADVCGNSANTAIKPHEKQVMKTFTLGLGASGYMQFSQSYLTDTAGDYYAIKEGVAPNAAAGICSWQSSGSCNWPAPASNTLTTIDDLWHAAVNGGGTYFSASNPTTLYTGLASAIKSLDGQVGAAASATTSNPNVSAGDNQVFISNFKSSEWSGELTSRRLDVNTGAVEADIIDWSARDRLDANAARSLYMFSSSASNKLKEFSWDAMSADERTYFSLTHVKATGRALTQFCSFGPYCLSSDNQTAAAGDPLVRFLRGERGNEGDQVDPTKFYRQRTYQLGDIVNSEAVYVSKSLVSYSDTDYGTFQTTVAGRQGMVYVGANDGMLHAFRTDTGAEAWAFVPSAVLPNLYKLADKQYATQHQYFVDGTPVVQDVKIGGEWRTILVGGLGGGGRAYYALDVTDPAAPKALWEFTDTNLGLTYGKPEIGKLVDGTWVVVFASGYNNVSPGDGLGRLYVVDAGTGTLIRSIATTAGSTTTPSGLAQIRGWVENSELDNTMLRVYGGDNLGNLWRFDINNNVGAPGYDAQRIATLKSATGGAQPITSRPELGQVGSYAMVFVGTGRYLGLSDLTDGSAQSIYGIKDKLNATDIGNPRTPANAFVQQTLTAGTCPSGSSACTAGETVRTNGTPQAVNLATNGGWYVDLPQTRERVNTDPQLALGTLVVNTNVIESGNVCTVGGSSWANFFDYRTGGAVDSANTVVSVSLGDAVATRPALIKLPNNKVISITRLSDDRTVSSPMPTPSKADRTRRLSYRDLLQQ